MEKLKFSTIAYTKEVEIDWYNDFSVSALNLSTFQFENCSMIGPKSMVFISKSDEYYFTEDIAEIAKKQKASFLLYSNRHFVIGYVVEFE